MTDEERKRFKKLLRNPEVKEYLLEEIRQFTIREIIREIREKKNPKPPKQIH